MEHQSTKQLRKKEKKDLESLLKKERAHLRDLMFRLSGAQLKNISEVTQTRRSIARILTILKQKNG